MKIQKKARRIYNDVENKLKMLLSGKVKMLYKKIIK